MKKNRNDGFPLPGNLSRILLRMKFTFVLLLLAMIPVFASVNAQTVTLKKQNASLEEIIWELKEKTKFVFLYSDEDIAAVRGISINVKDLNVDEVLRKCLEGTGLHYVKENNAIIIRQLRNDQGLPQAKARKITGKVTDKTGQPLPGVTVLIEGTSVGVTTDAGGKYSLECPTLSKLSLQFTFVGMTTQKVNVGERQEVNVVMEEDALEIDEVVVTGIYERKKESFTGSASTFKKEDLKMVGTQNLIQSLRTLDPAFVMMESNQFGSDPNKLPDIEIRGKTSVIGLKEQFGTDPNQPLFILDGFETTLRTVMDLNMDRVESVTLLKDAASTAIYGSKAANGVVVIETKKPEKGRFKVSYSGDFSLSIPDLTDYNLMNAEEKLEFELKAGYYKAKGNDAADQARRDSLYNAHRAEVARGVNTYWMNEPLRVSFSHKHNMYAEGGDEQIRYGLGVNYNGTAGVMKGSTRDILGCNFDLTYRKSKFQFANKLSVDYNRALNPTVPFSEYSRANPYYRKTKEDGTVGRYLESYMVNGSEYTVGNPLWNSGLNNLDEEKKFGFTDNFNAEWRIMPTFIVRGRLGLGKSATRLERFVSPQHSSFNSVAQEKKGKFTSTNSGDFYYDGDFTVTYGALLRERHQINAVVGARFRSSESTSESYTVVGFPVGDFTKPSFSNGFTENSKPTYSESVSRSNSFYFNGGYSYDNRYLLDANIRLDGSSVFGTNKRYSETWAVGLAWNLHNEVFIKGSQWLNRFKIRASVGNPGNQSFSSYQSFTSYSFNNWLQNSFGASVIVDQIGNPDLKWQKTLDKNIGADISMFGNRLNINADYYVKDTDPLLIYITVPSSVGVTQIGTNMGSQVNKGVNGTVKFSPVYRPQERVNWTLSFNFRHEKSYYKSIGNSLEKLNEANRDSKPNNDYSYSDKNTSLTRYYDGGSPTALWSVRSLGIDPATGKEVFLKKDGTYSFDYNTEDEVIVGNSQPKLEGVVGSTLYYKGFSFSFFLRYRIGADVFNNAMYTKVENISESSLKYNQDKRALYDRWQQAGDIAQFKGISLTETTQISSRFVQTENMLSGESFSLGYDFESSRLKRFGMSALRLQANMNDIFRISSVKEERGIDYPFARTVSMSLSVTF